MYPSHQSQVRRCVGPSSSGLDASSGAAGAEEEGDTEEHSTLEKEGSPAYRNPYFGLKGSSNAEVEANAARGLGRHCLQGEILFDDGSTDVAGLP